MRVELLYFDGCPSYQTAERLLREVIGEEDISAEIVRIRVADETEAQRLKFSGSPTICIDGVDPFARGEAHYGLECRVFVTPEGLKGWPTKAMLKDVLKRRG
ncbi:MAG TPA: thioredoxin family protein [Anaerolineae bacterium]